MRTFQIDFSDIDREAGEDIFSPISRALGFPDWFGGNLDALWDMLTGYIETPCRVILLSTGSVRKDEKSYLERIIEVFREAEEYGVVTEVRN